MSKIGDFLSQWTEVIEIIVDNYFSGRLDGITFPLTLDLHGMWGLLAKSDKAVKIMRRKIRFMGAQRAYAFLRENRNQLGFIGYGSIPGPRNREEALIAFGNQEEADLWEQERRGWPKQGN